MAESGIRAVGKGVGDMRSSKTYIHIRVKSSPITCPSNTSLVAHLSSHPFPSPISCPSNTSFVAHVSSSPLTSPITCRNNTSFTSSRRHAAVQLPSGALLIFVQALVQNLQDFTQILKRSCRQLCTVAFTYTLKNKCNN